MTEKVWAPPVRINGKDYQTVIDEYGVRRYRESSVLRHLIDTGAVNLNQLAVDFHGGKFSAVDYLEFNMGLGYSVLGLCDLHVFFGQPEDGMFAGLGWKIEQPDADCKKCRGMGYLFPDGDECTCWKPY